MERNYKACFVCRSYFPPPAIHTPQIRIGFVFPRYTYNTNPQPRNVVSRFKINSGVKESVDYYRSQLEIRNSNRKVVTYRSVSEIPLQDREAGGRPVLIHHNKSSMDAGGIHAVGNNQSVTDAVLINHDGVIQTVAGKGQLQKVPVGRTSSTAPNFQRVRAWLSDNDFANEFQGALPVNGKTGRNAPDLIPKQWDNKRIVVSTPNVHSPTKNRHQIPPPPPPPPPPPAPPAPPLPTSKLKPHENGSNFHHQTNPFSGHLQYKVRSPDEISKPKLLFSSEMAAAAKRSPSKLQHNHKTQPFTQSSIVPTSPSESNFENFVDSVFANALGSESDGKETPSTDRRFSLFDSQGGTLHSPPFVGNTDGAEALLVELRDKLKRKGLSSEHINDFNDFDTEDGNKKGANKTETRSGFTRFDMQSDVISREFTPLDTSTPQPEPHNIADLESKSGEQSTKYSLTQSFSPTRPKTMMLTDSIQYKHISESTSTHKHEDITHQKVNFVTINDSKHQSRDTHGHSNTYSKVDRLHTSQVDANYSETPNWQQSLPLSRQLISKLSKSDHSLPTQQKEDESTKLNSIYNKNNYFTGSLPDQLENSQNFKTDVKPRSEFTHNTNTAGVDGQTNEEFNNNTKSGAGFKYQQNGAHRVWFVGALEIPEQGIDRHYNNSCKENNIVLNVDKGRPFDVENPETHALLPKWDPSNVSILENGSLFYNIKSIPYLSTTGIKFDNGGADSLEPNTLRPECKYTTVCVGSSLEASRYNYRTSLGEGHYTGDNHVATFDPNFPADIETDTRTVYGVGDYDPPSSTLEIRNVGLSTDDEIALFRPRRHTPPHSIERPQQSGEVVTHLKFHHATNGGISDSPTQKEFLHSGRRPSLDRPDRFSFEEYVTPFTVESSSGAKVTRFTNNNRHTCEVSYSYQQLNDSENFSDNVNSNVIHSRQEFDNFDPGIYHSQFVESEGDIVVQKSPLNCVRFTNAVSELDSNFTFPEYRVNKRENYQANVVDDLSDDTTDDTNDDDDTPDWTSSSSSDNETNLQRFPSSLSQDTFNSIFAHGANVTLRARADRTLTGSHNNLLSNWLPRNENELIQQTAQSRSAPGTSREKKKNARSLSTKKILGKSFFDPGRRTSDVWFEPKSTDRNLVALHADGHGPASPTTINISSSNNGNKIVRIYQANSDSQTPQSTTMLSSSNHDHELLPPSASNAAKKGSNNNIYSSNSLLRSKSMFTSTPSLFVRSSPEEKFWKKEAKKEKEEKKRLEEERKRLEKQAKKEEKRRLKLERKAATVNARNIPRDWNHRSGPVEHVYMRPALRMSTVPIEYTDDPRTRVSLQPAHSEHYATPSVMARGGVYATGASPADVSRVEQLYGTTQRRPVSTHSHSHYATPYGYLPPREHHPRVVLLHRNPDGYGFVLRGAKFKHATGGGFNDFTPTADHPALQYLDSVDPGSQGHRAGLLAGDFILEINGENVMRASHDHVVHLIRSSSDVLTLKVVTVTQPEPTPNDWYAFQEYGAMTLPNRKSVAAPLPPQRDPQTSLSFSKASSKSMTEGLAEIEKLDAAIAEFDSQDEPRIRSHQLSDDQKVASVRASHALKRVSVMDYEGLITGEPGSVDASGKGHVSPAEARVKKYHKRSPSQTIERSKSTPDISAALDQEYSEHNSGGHITGSWTKSQAPPPPPHSNAKHVSPFNGAVYSNKIGAPDSVLRQPVMPPASEIVRIHTAGKNSNHSNITAETESRKKKESQYESSFRPESSQNVILNSDQTTIVSRNNTPAYNGDKNISFADERILENAHKFVQKYPNATVLVTADIHSDKTDRGKNEIIYEPVPDYDENEEDKPVYFKNSSPVANTTPNQNRDTIDAWNNVTNKSKSTVTVISINSDASKDHTRQTSGTYSSTNVVNSAKFSPHSIHTQESMALTSPVQSISSSRRSSGVVMATPSQPSSAGSSRRSSIQSNYSGENVDRNGRNYITSSTSTIIVGNSKDSSHDVPPPPPPPPPLLGAGKSSREGSANSSLRMNSKDVEVITSVQGRVSTDDILAAVADRQNRMENEGPRVSDVKGIPKSKSSHELNQEALKAAVAARKSRLEQQSEEKSVVDEIESRLNKNKKLQAAKYYGSDANRNSGAPSKEESVPPPPIQVAVSTNQKIVEKSTNIPPAESTTKPTTQVKVSPVEPLIKQGAPVKPSPAVPVKSNVDKQSPAVIASNSNPNVDFRAKLKPVDIKGSITPLVAQSKPTLSSATDVATPGTNITTIVMTKANPGKAPAPPPPPPPPPMPVPTSAVGAVAISSSTTKQKSDPVALSTSRAKQNTVETKPVTTNPISPTSPSANSIPSSADYIALAERARQEYLKKKAAGTLQANIEKKGPVEITPNIKNTQRNKPTTPTSPANAPPPSLIKSNGPTLIEIKPKSGTNGESVQISSVQDRIKLLQSENGVSNGKTKVAGVTEDHSHTETSLSNGTIKKPSPKSNVLPPLNITSASSPGLGSKIAPPPPGFGDNDVSSSYKGVAIDIIPPPSSFSAAGSPDSALSVPSYGQDDAASFVSSVSSLSTLSSEQGDNNHQSQKRENIKELFTHSPPPPPEDEYFSLGDQNAFIPPPPEFLEIDSNANESKAMDKNSKPFSTKSVVNWSCMDVLDWLDSLNLPQYRISFAKAQINGNKLANMGRNEFINLGVTQVVHRMNLERSVKKLSMSNSTNL